MQWYEQFLWALRKGAIPAGRITSNAGALEHKPATSTINCTVSGTIRDSMDDILDEGARGGAHAEGRLRHRLRVLDAAPARRVRLRRRRVHVRARCRSWISTTRCASPCPPPAAAAARRWARSTSAIRTRWISSAPSARTAGCGSSTCRCWSPTSSCRRCKANARLEAGVPAARRSEARRRRTSSDADQVRLARVADARRLRRQRGRPGRLQDLQDAAGAAHVGRDHVVHVRFRRARLHPDRPRQRDEQQLVVREHPRHQPVRRAAAAAVRLVPARLGQPHALRASIRSPSTRAFDWDEYREVVKRVHAHARQRGRDQRPAARAAARRDHCASAATAWASSASARTITMLGMKYGSRKSVAVHRRTSRARWRSPAGKRRWSWRARRARRRS